MILVKCAAALCLSGAMLAAGASCSGGGSVNHGTGRIDVVAALADADEEITLSMLGSKIRFVPLETTDSSLVGANWDVRPLPGGKLVVTNTLPMISSGVSDCSVMVFDLADGRFLNTVAQAGQGPGDYKYPMFKVDTDGQRLYFPAGSGAGVVCYGVDGSYKGTVCRDVRLTTSLAIRACEDSVAYMLSYDSMSDSRQASIVRYGMDGALIDSMTVFARQSKVPYELSFEPDMRAYSLNTVLNKQRGTVLDIATGDRDYVIPTSSVWLEDGDAYYYEAFSDTIFRVTPGGAVADLIIDMGEHSLPVCRLNELPFSSDHWIVTDVKPCGDRILFGFTQGWLRDDSHKEYAGIYNRRTGELHLAPMRKDGFRDDLSGFMPLSNLKPAPDGSLVGVLTMDEIAEFLEKNPDVEAPEWYGALDPDANPVAVIITP